MITRHEIQRMGEGMEYLGWQPHHIMHGETDQSALAMFRNAKKDPANIWNQFRLVRITEEVIDDEADHDGVPWVQI